MSLSILAKGYSTVVLTLASIVVIRLQEGRSVMFGSIVSSLRESLTPEQALELANVYLENAFNAKDPTIALELCHDAEVSLSQAKKAAKHDKNQTVTKSIANAYIGLGKLLGSRGYSTEEMAILKKAEKLG